MAFLSRIEPEIFEHDDLSGLHRLHGCPNISARWFTCLCYGTTKEFAQSFGHGLQSQFLRHPSVWPAEMRAQNDLGLAAHEVVDRWQGGPDAGIVRDDSRSGYEGNVEVRSDKDGLCLRPRYPERSFCVARFHYPTRMDAASWFSISFEEADSSVLSTTSIASRRSSPTMSSENCLPPLSSRMPRMASTSVESRTRLK